VGNERNPNRMRSKTGWLVRPGTGAAWYGFTLVELVITVAIILTLTAIAIPNAATMIENAKVARAVGDVHSIGTTIIGYQAVQSQFPNTLADVGYGNQLDPWGKPYQYLNFANVSGKGPMRKDRFLVPINSAFDLYSMGQDGQSVPPLTAKASQDDVIWENDGSYIGLASEY
jgi:general secretion pathway protein G